jgi:putative flippase GtrA
MFSISYDLHYTVAAGYRLGNECNGRKGCGMYATMMFVVNVLKVVRNPFMRFEHRLNTATGKRFKRFLLAAVVAVAASQTTLTLCLGLFHTAAGTAGFIAWVAGAASSYLMTRWAWERKGRPHLLKETLPFWIIAVCVAIILTTTTKLASEASYSMSLSHAQRILFVDLAFFIANCFTFLARFFIFHYLLFAGKKNLNA